MKQFEIGSLEALKQFIATSGHDWGSALVQGLDLTDVAIDQLLLRETGLAGAVFLECQLSPAFSVKALEDGALLFPVRVGLPFNPGRSTLYAYTDLLAGYDPGKDDTYRQTPDWKCYLASMDPKTMKKRTDLSIDDYVFFRFHDLSIEHALDKYLHPNPGDSATFKRAVGIMGGHDCERSEKTQDKHADSTYMTVAILAWKLARLGLTIVTGGGPGAMEAGNLGAWFASYSEDKLRAAVRVLSTVEKVPKDPTNPALWDAGKWLEPAYKVIKDNPRDSTDPHTESVGVPTWYYGHEPPNPFATHIAKYFENSLREDGLLAIARKGVIFSEGNAGTVQEVFQNATQNYYQSLGPPAPMVLFSSRYWNRQPSQDQLPKDKPAWNLLRQLGLEKDFAHLLLLTDDIDAIIKRISS